VDFSREAWHLDRPDDLQTVTFWLAMGGSALADFATRPTDPRGFNWCMGAHPAVVHHTMWTLKGRDPRWVPTSLFLPWTDALNQLDRGRAAVNPTALEALLQLGSVGLRFPVKPGAYATHLIQHGPTGPIVQVVPPRVGSTWERWIEDYLRHTGQAVFTGSSANFTRPKKRTHSRGTHRALGELQADMGHLGIPILTGPIEVDGHTYGPDERLEGYRRLNAKADAAQRIDDSDGVRPVSTSIVALTDSPDRMRLLRHGSISFRTLRDTLQRHGVTLEHQASDRLKPAVYPVERLRRWKALAGAPGSVLSTFTARCVLLTLEDEQLLRLPPHLDEHVLLVLAGGLRPEGGPAEPRLHGEAVDQSVVRARPHVAVGCTEILCATTHDWHRVQESSEDASWMR